MPAQGQIGDWLPKTVADLFVGPQEELAHATDVAVSDGVVVLGGE